MRSLLRTALATTALVAIAVTSASASNNRGFSGSSSCRGSSFSTCASGLTGNGHGVITVIGSWFNQWRNQGGWGNHGGNNGPGGNGGNQGGPGGNQGGNGGNQGGNGGYTPPGGPGGNIGGPGEPPPVVTPEPVTMTLLATGLAGMGGVGALRRRKQKQLEG